MSTLSSKLSCDQLRWRCNQKLLRFETTDEVDTAKTILGQQTAREAMLFGLRCDAPGQNIYVRGSRGTGRRKMVKRMLEELAPTTNEKCDYCYVHDFKHPDRPRLLSLPPGKAQHFSRRVKELAEFIQEGLIKALESEPYASQRTEIKEKIQQTIKSISEPLEQDLAANNMALVSVQQGPMTVPVIFPVVDGKPVQPEMMPDLIQQGDVTEEQNEQFKKMYPSFRKRLQKIGRSVNEAYKQGSKAVEQFNEQAARELLGEVFDPIFAKFEGQGISEFIQEIVDDAVENRLEPTEQEFDLKELYGVNIVLQQTDTMGRPVVEESTPNLMNLLGTVESKFGPGGVAISDYRGIRAGALLNADHGYLILNVEDLLNEPGAWVALMRTLRTGQLEIVPPEMGWMRQYVVVQPERIKINVRVILIGDVPTYYQLDHFDSDFRELFKVLADFDDELPRDESGLAQYASVISNMVDEEGLLPFHRSAVAALSEHGARIVARPEKLTARFGRIADIAREGAFLAQQSNSELVEETHIYDAVSRTKKRANMPSRRFQEFIERGTIIVETTGEVAGQVNGLAVMQAGQLTYGFPARITASIGPGRSGLINIEATARMSGSIHTKGFHILGGLLRHLLKLSHPLAFNASIAFEQSYGGIDGDSASGAEIVCLLSALTGIPIKQSFAMTGAIDQHGHIEAIGGVNEKIEGFFDTCAHFGLTGEQGVVIPQSNAGELMLRQDIVDACSNGQFHVYAVSRIHTAIELMMGVPAGQPVNGEYADGTVLNLAVKKAHEYWRRTLSSPERFADDVHDPRIPDAIAENQSSPPPSVQPEQHG